MRRTVIVEGPLAFRMNRIAAARRGECGVQIATLPLLAARLAGGFTRPARSQDLEPAIRTALAAGGFRELERMRQLPGMTRSITLTLTKIWHSDLPLENLPSHAGRVADLLLIEQRVRTSLPAGVLTPRDLRDGALKRLTHAAAVLGAVELDGLVTVAPVWRPLLQALRRMVDLCWRNPGASELGWFPGDIITAEIPPAPAIELVSCANPHAEAVESLRWICELIASGRARPEDIAVCATSTDDWDEHFLVLATDARLPIHFSHGVPALASPEGQACGALADVLLNGLSQDRIRRLVGHAAGRQALQELPQTWAAGLQPGAALFELDQWRRALDEASSRRADGRDPRPVLMPVLELLAKGPDAAQQAGEVLLGTAARSLWTEALRRAPAKALEYSLQELRVPDGRDPGACAVWCPASHLAGARRPWVRLLGLTSRWWPRRWGEDPLLPSHLLSPGMLDPDSITDRDRRAFHLITRHAAGGCVLSRSRRNAQGALLSPSALASQARRTVILKRTRIPQHAFSETDRLLARPDEAAASPAIAAATGCWRNWRRPGVTAHDGRTRADHPIISRAIDALYSATSLRLMLRDPLGFVWRYALGWRSVPDEDQPLMLDARAYGELVHEILKRTVDALEPSPGYARAVRHELEAALAEAVATTSAQWPLERSVPPMLLWQHTLEAAAQLAFKALTLDEAFLPDTRSWTELGFGQPIGDKPAADDSPWCPDAEVMIPGTNIRIQGSIDRLDLNAAGSVRVSDYKTGEEPKQADRIVLAGGAELQRAIYAVAARQLLPNNPRVVARLVFLGEDRPHQYKLPDVDSVIAELGSHVTAACALLRHGAALPGPDARENWNDFRLALPAATLTYFQIKQGALSQAFGDFARVWSCR
jgi:hypothetical protein